MYLFIIVNLCIAFLLQGSSIVREIFLSEYVIYIGALGMLLNFIAGWTNFNFISYKLRYDFFAVSALLVWFAYWPAFFREGTPLFYGYTLYFALITALFSLVFITKRERIDPDALAWLEWLSDTGRFNPIIVKFCVGASLFFPQQFILFPLAMSLLIMRFTLACCLSNE